MTTPERREDVEYDVPVFSSLTRAVTRHERKRGYRVGRLAVRLAEPNERFRDQDGRCIERVVYVVDHIESGLSVTSASTFSAAMMLADDVSRFAAQDLTATSSEGLLEQLGTPLLEWLNTCLDESIGYRQWRASRGAA